MRGDDGEWYAIHEGEWVEMLPRRTFAEIKEYQHFQTLSADLDVLKPAEGDESEDAIAARREMQTKQRIAFEELCAFLAGRVVRWNWTGPTGRLLGEPNDSYVNGDGSEHPCHKLSGPEDIERLDAAEIFYLLNVEQGDAPAERKNGSGGSPITSSASSPKATAEPPATSGRNPMKR